MRFLLAGVIFLLLSFTALHRALAEQTLDKGASTSSDSGWIRMFDGKTLNGWYTFIERQKKNADPAKIFQVQDGVIHVYKDQVAGGDAVRGYVATETEYANYNLRLQYKWGEKKFGRATEQRRDTGLLYHVQPPDVVWPRCIECQIQEGDVGDCWLVRGVRVVASVETALVKTVSGPKNLPIYKPEADGGSAQTIGGGPNTRIVKSSTQERDGWNTVEVKVRGSEGTEHIVNGHTVFAAKDLQQLSAPAPSPNSTGDAKQTFEPLSRGRIALQAEYAEVLYRNIEIRPNQEAAKSK